MRGKRKFHSWDVRWRAFRMWQNLGFNPWQRPKEERKKGSKDFYKGAFDSIPFLNDDAKRTFVPVAASGLHDPRLHQRQA